MIEVTFNGTRLNDSFHVSNIERPLPPFENAETRVEGRDGAVHDGLTIGPAEVSMRLHALDRTERGLQDAARSLMAALAVRSPAPLELSDELDAYGTQLVRYAVPDGSPSHKWLRSGEGYWDVTFEQPDPHLHGRRRSAVLERNVPTLVEMGGNAPVRPVFTSTPRGDYPIWGVAVYGGANSSGGRDYRAQVNFDSRYLDRGGQAFSGTNGLVADFEAQAVTFDRMAYDAGWPVRGLTPTSRFFELSGAEQVVSPYTRTTMNWTERWL